MKKKNQIDSSKFCPTSCESLYGGKCIMRLKNDSNPIGFRLLYYELGFGRHYIRREDCPLRENNNE